MSTTRFHGLIKILIVIMIVCVLILPGCGDNTDNSDEDDNSDNSGPPTTSEHLYFKSVPEHGASAAPLSPSFEFYYSKSDVASTEPEERLPRNVLSVKVEIFKFPSSDDAVFEWAGIKYESGLNAYGGDGHSQQEHEGYDVFASNSTSIIDVSTESENRGIVSISGVGLNGSTETTFNSGSSYLVHFFDDVEAGDFKCWFVFHVTP